LRPGDTLVVWKLDRAGRSLTHLIELLKSLKERGIEFISLTEQIDTTTPGGKLIFHLMGALAEFERDLIRERTNAGLAAAKARGRVGGRPRKLKTNGKVAVLATWHICSKKSAHVGSTGSFSLLSTHQIDDVRVSCMKFTL